MLILMRAIEHQISLPVAFLAEGVFMLSLVAGSSIPGEFGSSEGAFVFFAASLGIHRARALSVALLLHVVKFAFILVGSLIPLIWKTLDSKQQSI
jgi:hypothetical protein